MRTLPKRSGLVIIGRDPARSTIPLCARSILGGPDARSNVFIFLVKGGHIAAPFQVRSVEDLHYFLVDLEGCCDVAAFHKEDEDIAASVRAAEYAARAKWDDRPCGVSPYDHQP